MVFYHCWVMHDISCDEVVYGKYNLVQSARSTTDRVRLDFGGIVLLWRHENDVESFSLSLLYFFFGSILYVVSFSLGCFV